MGTFAIILFYISGVGRYLPVRSMREGYAFVSVCVRTYMCACRQKTRLFASYRSKLSTKTLSAASSLNLYSPLKTFSVLASLAPAANPWLSKATCPCKSTLRYCGCVTQPPIHVDVPVSSTPDSSTLDWSTKSAM